MLVMPMNRNMTWGDRQAEAAREKNLKRLQKLAAMSPAATPSAELETSATTTAKAKPPAKAAARQAKPKASTTAKKSKPGTAKKSKKS
jgi:hypothetical protein